MGLLAAKTASERGLKQVESTADTFEANARKALADSKLQDALSRLAKGFPMKRLEAAARLPEFEALRPPGGSCVSPPYFSPRQ